MSHSRWLLSASLLMLAHSAGLAAPALKVLIVDGQNNHAWKETTPVLKKMLEDSKLFTVDVATSPAKGGDMITFKPDFAKYAVVVSNYNGESWSAETKAAFEKYMRAGGGLVSYHAADNSFPEWKEYNEMVAVGGWGGTDDRKVRPEGSLSRRESSVGFGSGPLRQSRRTVTVCSGHA